MPQASEELRARWDCDDEKAINFLEDRGFILGKDWCWRHPTNRDLDEEESSAMTFLIDEWDFGWYAPFDMPERGTE